MANGQADPSGRESQNPTEELAQAAKSEADRLKEQARETAAGMKEGAREMAEDVKQQVRATAAQQKDVAADQVGGLAHALMTASDDLHSRGQDSAAAWMRQAAAGLERASGTMRERGIDDLVGTVEEFARRQPVAFLGGAVVAGFGLARLLKSSADRRRHAAPEHHRGEQGRLGEGSGTAAGLPYGEHAATAAGTRYGEETGTPAERRFGQGAGTAAGTHYGEGGGL